MKKYGVAIAVLAALVCGQKAMAVVQGNPVDVEVYAQIDTTLELTLTSATSYDFGTVSANLTVMSATTFDIRNTGGGITETLQLKGNNSSNWAIAPQGSGRAADMFALYGTFNFPAVPGAFNDANHQIGSAYQASSGVKYAGSETGLSVPNGESRRLWVTIDTPASSSSSARQRIQIDVLASQP